jgi:hypothetical protein
MNILQQNPAVFTSSTSPTPYLISAMRDTAAGVAEFIAMDQDQLDKSLSGFFREGLKGWYEGLTDKPVVISKSRVWDQELNTIFRLYKNPKIILNLRDLRDIVCSYEKLMFKYPMWNFGSREDPVNRMPRNKRIEIYCTDVGANLGRPLKLLPHIFEWMQKRPECFFTVRIEDFNIDSEGCFRALYNWLELPYFEHDLNNIPQAAQYEHDTTYRTFVSHKTEPKFRPLEQSYKTMLTHSESIDIIHNNTWFYETFYPEIYNEYLDNIKSVS